MCPCSGNNYYIWKEDLSDKRHTERLKTVNFVIELLAKYFSQSHKKRVRKAMELIMQDKILPAQYHTIYHELTGDKSVSYHHFSKETDEKMKMIFWAADANVFRDLCIQSQRKGSFDPFWEFTEQKMEELTAVNDRHHCETTRNGNVAVKLALTCSVGDLSK